MGRERGREGLEKISDDDSSTSTVVGVSGEVVNRREQSHLAQVGGGEEAFLSALIMH